MPGFILPQNIGVHIDIRYRPAYIVSNATTEPKGHKPERLSSPDRVTGR